MKSFDETVGDNVKIFTSILLKKFLIRSNDWTLQASVIN